jgi:hypothetical protein
MVELVSGCMTMKAMDRMALLHMAAAIIAYKKAGFIAKHRV